jgi:fructokinase
VLDPDVIVLGGGMSRIDRLYPALEANLKAYVFGKEFATPIRPAAHGDSSGIRGAAWLWPADEG